MFSQVLISAPAVTDLMQLTDTMSSLVTLRIYENACTMIIVAQTPNLDNVSQNVLDIRDAAPLPVNHPSLSEA